MPSPLIGFGLSRQVSLEHHLRANHYPPIDLRWVPICEAAIDLAISVGEQVDDDSFVFDEHALEAQVGQGKTAQEVLDGLHLWEYVSSALVADEYHDEPKAGE